MGFYTLFLKEWMRFWKVAVQTVLAPVLTAMLYLLVFAHTLRGHVEVYPGVDYASFLIPGLAMMAVLQNAFANSSSSLIQSKRPACITTPTAIASANRPNSSGPRNFATSSPIAKLHTVFTRKATITRMRARLRPRDGRAGI